jgi:phage host-nuclease inhibitor protein Gam
MDDAAKASADLFDLIKLWADNNEWEFAEVRTMELTHGKLGYRKGQPTLKLLNGFNWEGVLQYLKEAKASGYIRVKEEVNKETLIQDRAKIGPESLAEMGVKVVQDESFFVEAKVDDLSVETASRTREQPCTA